MKRWLVFIVMVMMANVTLAQDLDATFVSSYEGNLTFKYPSDWIAYEDESEYLVVVSRERISSSAPVDTGQAALIFLTPQGLEATGMTITDADDAIDEFLGEMPEDAQEMEFLSEYGKGYRFDFNLTEEMDFTIIGFNNNDMPLIAIIGMNQPDPDEVDTLIRVIKTARYGGNPELVNNTYAVERDGYRFEVPNDWTPDELSFVVPNETFLYATVLLVDENMSADAGDAVNFDSVIQDELELLAGEFIDETEVVVEDGEPISGHPTKEVLMTYVFVDGVMSFDIEYRFVLVDYGDDRVLLSAIYGEEFGITEAYMPTLREIAESLEFTTPSDPPDTIEHAGLQIPYPDGFEVFTTAPDIIRLLGIEGAMSETVIEISNPTQTQDWYPSAADGDVLDVAKEAALTYEVTTGDVTEISLENGTVAVQFIVENETTNLVFLAIDTESGIIALTASYSGDEHTAVTDLLQTMASDLEVVDG